jgi:hypothetical protein
MKKYRGKLIAVAALACLLTAAWMLGGSYQGRGETAEATTPAAADAEVRDVADGVTDAVSDVAKDGVADAASDIAEDGVEGAAGAVADKAKEPYQAMDINPETGKDRYQTEPVPQGRPVPVEPQDAVLGDGEFTCTLTVRCDALLGDMESLDKEKWGLVPDDGLIFPATAVKFYEGESVFNLLSREMKRAKIHMEFMNTPIYNSAYIEGIGNIYEFDAGGLSGWMYSVNGWYPNYGCSRYLLRDGDVIEWNYTRDLGRDIGADGILGYQRDE